LVETSGIEPLTS